MIEGSLSVAAFTDPITYVSATSNVFAVLEISEDSWNYDTAVVGGDWSLALNSAFIKATKDGYKSGFLLETGPVADQSFANGASTGTPALYVGGSDYSAIFDST